MLPYLFVKEHRKILGRTIKHPGSICKYGGATPSILLEKPLDFIGLDFETDSSGRPRLLGKFWKGFYRPVYGDSQRLFKAIVWDLRGIHEKYIKKEVPKGNINLVCWTKFDLNALMRLFLENATEKQKEWFSVSHKIPSEWNSKEEDWTTPPMIEINVSHIIKKHKATIGILRKISNKQIVLFFRNGEVNKYGKPYPPTQINFVDIQQLYNKNLTQATEEENIEYEKGDEEFHIIDWKRYEEDEEYQKGVLRSNKDDARAAQELASKISEKFNKAFDCHPNTILSTGSFAKSAMTQILGKERYKSLNWQTQRKEWFDSGIEPQLIDFTFLMACESYRGGIFDVYRIGSVNKAYIADQASCYTSAMTQLKDFRGSILTYFEGEPPKPKENELVLIQGKAHIPKDIDHTLFIQHPIKKSLIRPYGAIDTSFWYQEKMHIEKQGGTFSDERGVLIKLTGKPSPISEASEFCIDKREELVREGDGAANFVKTVGNSLYGTTIEGHEIYEMKDGKQSFLGFRTGRNFNPLIASLITMQPRVISSESMLQIAQNGGIPLQINTDDSIWAGEMDHLPKNFKTTVGKSGWREKKTRGFFEMPTVIEDFVSTSNGRWSGYHTGKKKYINKLRGYRTPGNDRKNILRIKMEEHKNEKECRYLKFKTREFVSCVLINHRDNYTADDICKIVDTEKDLGLHTMANKKIMPQLPPNPIETLLNDLVCGEQYNADAYFDINDPVVNLRKEVLRKMEGAEEIRIEKKTKRRNYHANHKTKQRKANPQKYKRENILNKIRYHENILAKDDTRVKSVIKLIELKKELEELNGEI